MWNVLPSTDQFKKCDAVSRRFYELRLLWDVFFMTLSRAHFQQESYFIQLLNLEVWDGVFWCRSESNSVSKRVRKDETENRTADRCKNGSAFYREPWRLEIKFDRRKLKSEKFGAGRDFFSHVWTVPSIIEAMLKFKDKLIFIQFAAKKCQHRIETAL